MVDPVSNRGVRFAPGRAVPSTDTAQPATKIPSASGATRRRRRRKRPEPPLPARRTRFTFNLPLVHRKFTLCSVFLAVKHAETQPEVSGSSAGAASAEGADVVHHGVRDVDGGGVDIARPLVRRVRCIEEIDLDLDNAIPADT